MTAASAAGGMQAASPPATRVWPVALAGLAIWALAILVNAPLKLDHDESYFLASGRILNQGARLYTDWVDFNTTAPSGLGRYSAWLASVLHTPLDLTHKSTIFLLALVGLGVAFAVMLPALRKPGPARWVFAIGIPVVLLFATPEIGRREHLMSIGIMGWVGSIILAASGVRRPWPIALAAGVVAGLVLYEKPHFALFGLALGVIDLVRARFRLDRLLISTWVAAAVSIALYLWLVLANPDFLGLMLPATVDLYGPLAAGWQWAAKLLVRDSALRGAALLLATFALWREAETRPPWTAFAVAGAFVITAAALYVQQGLGFEYHRLPLDIAFNMICLGLLAWGLSDGRISAKRPFHLSGVAAAGVLLLGALSSQLSYFSRFPHRDSVIQSPLLEAVRPPQAGDPILIITTDIRLAADVLTFLDVRWSGAFISHFPIPALIRQDGRDGLRHPLAEEKRERWTRWFRGKVAERFCAALPVRVAVETTERPVFFQNSGFDMLAWLREDPDFDACWVAARLSPVGEPFEAERHSYQAYAAK
jgi:hypothetical protein